MPWVTSQWAHPTHTPSNTRQISRTSGAASRPPRTNSCLCGSQIKASAARRSARTASTPSFSPPTTCPLLPRSGKCLSPSLSSLCTLYPMPLLCLLLSRVVNICLRDMRTLLRTTSMALCVLHSSCDTPCCCTVSIPRRPPRRCMPTHSYPLGLPVVVVEFVYICRNPLHLTILSPSPGQWQLCDHRHRGVDEEAPARASRMPPNCHFGHVANFW